MGECATGQPPAVGMHPESLLTPGTRKSVSSRAKLFDSRIGSSQINGGPDCLPDLLCLVRVQSPMGRRVELNICPLDWERLTLPDSSTALLYEAFKTEIRVCLGYSKVVVLRKQVFLFSQPR